MQSEVEAAATREFRQNGAIVAVESLGGKELHYFARSWNDGVEDLSPVARFFITQVGLEPVLRERASELGPNTASLPSWRPSSSTTTTSSR